VTALPTAERESVIDRPPSLISYIIEWVIMLAWVALGALLMIVVLSFFN
jgi:hypothetical protein